MSSSRVDNNTTAVMAPRSEGDQQLSSTTVFTARSTTSNSTAGAHICSAAVTQAVEMGADDTATTTTDTVVIPYATETTESGAVSANGASEAAFFPVYPVTLKFEELVYKVKLVGHHRPRTHHSTTSSCCFGFGGRTDHRGGTSGTVAESVTARGRTTSVSSPTIAETETTRRPSEKTILNGISGVVCPGELLALLGPSGSGKTTLLTALAGRLSGYNSNGILSGKITYNGQPFSGPMRRRTGFVAQDDVLYPHLTVRETLLFTSLLRLPSSLSAHEKACHVDRVISDLGLTRVAHSMVGGPLFRGISGGEKKRLSIGLEMLINPSLLLLDEPTSGLDSTTAQRIITTLKNLAVSGRTVITTIHQPSSRLYLMFDKVILLSEGCPIYHGPASHAISYFSSIGFTCSNTIHLNPADLMLDLANGIASEDSEYAMEHKKKEGSSYVEKLQPKCVREALITSYDKNIVTRLKAELCLVDVTSISACYNKSNMLKHKNEWSTTWCEQFKVLLSRSLKERRYEAFNRLRIFQVISVATLAGLLWWHTPPSHLQDRTSLLFFFAVFWGFYPLYNAVFTFPQERSMLIKERSSGMYRLSSYFLARTIGDLPMELALPTAFVIIVYWMGGLKPDPWVFILSLMIVLFSVLVSQSLGLAFGAILMDVKQATTLASVTTLVFLIAGGYYVQQIPPFIVWLKYLSYSFYCYKLLIGVHYQETDVYECSPDGIVCHVIDFPSIRSVGLNHMWLDACIMAIMLVGYRLIAYMALRRVIPSTN